MFLGRNRFLNQGGAAAGTGDLGVGGNPNFLNQLTNMPTGMQRFLAKKGINSSNDLFNRAQQAPHKPFRTGR